MTAPPRALPSSLVTTMPGGAHRLREEPALLHGVLAHGAVEHEQRLVRRARAAGGPTTRTTLRSSSIRPSWVCRRPAVSTMTVSSPRDMAASIASKATEAGSPPGHAGDARDAEPLGPDLQLRDGAGAVGVGRGEQHLPALALQPPGELGRGGGLAGAVDPDHQDDRRALGSARASRPDRLAVEHGGQPAFQRAPKIALGLELAAPDLVLQRLGELDRGGHAEIGLDEDALHLLEIVGVEPAHQRADVGHARRA